MECLGGNGYVEELLLPRLYREAPVNAIWEGSGNVMCLDMLRALKRDEEAALMDALFCESALPLDLKLDTADETTARLTVERIALAAAAAALKASAPTAVVDTFVRTRLAGSHGALYGAATIDTPTVDLLLQRVLPEN
jgi:putative acyl-CoA dehydrogenase